MLMLSNDYLYPEEQENLADLTTLQQALGVSFKQPLILMQALTHSSYANENPSLSPLANERLEFLGDAILGLIVAERLYRDFPSIDEGIMTKLRAYLVRQETLSLVAKDIGLGDYLYLGKGEEVNGGREKAANLARALEAIIAAVYLDQGYNIVEKLVLRLLEAEFENALTSGTITDYKSQFQEYLQAQGQPIPTYHLISTEGPDHDKTFTVEVRLGEAVLATSSGKSKKMAEMDAARIALTKLSVK
jgi:ribonuclease III